MLVDSRNNRVQKFTKDGMFLSKWGRLGTGDGEFNMPWGIEIDTNDDVYVVDWRNDRIQKFSSDGRFLAKFGTPGSEDGEFNRPTGVAVDKDGIIYVADRGNNRLQVFRADGGFIAKMKGDGTLSKWGTAKVDANAEMWKERENAHEMEREKLFSSPIAVEVDNEGRIFVVESARHRIQVYRKQNPHLHVRPPISVLPMLLDPPVRRVGVDRDLAFTAVAPSLSSSNGQFDAEPPPGNRSRGVTVPPNLPPCATYGFCTIPVNQLAGVRQHYRVLLILANLGGDGSAFPLGV